MSIIKKGITAAMINSGGHFLTLQPDQPVDVVLLHGLDDIQSVDTHSWWDYTPAPHLTCLGEVCPSCALGNEPHISSYYAVVTQTREVKYFIAKPSVITQLQKYEKALGNLAGRLVRLDKTGTGLKTKYSAIMLGKKLDVSKYEVPELESMLGPLTSESQLVKMTEAGIDVTSLKVTKKKVAKKTAPADAVEPVVASVEPDKAPWEDAEETTEEIDGWGTI